MTSQATLLDLLAQAPRSSSTARRTPPSQQLLAYLVECGRIDLVEAAGGARRNAAIRTCPGCRAVTLFGLDDDVAAFEARVDPYALTPLGEAMALLDERRTLSLVKLGGRWQLDWRDASKITFAPAGSRPRCDVVRSHRCGSPPPAEVELRPSSFAEATSQPLPANATAPF